MAPCPTRQQVSVTSETAPNYSLNLSAGGSGSARTSSALSPAAGYAERYAYQGHTPIATPALPSGGEFLAPSALVSLVVS